MHGRSEDLEEVRRWTRKLTHSIEDGYWLLKQHPCSHATAEGLSPLVSHFVIRTLLRAYIASLRLSWIIQDNRKLATYAVAVTNLRSKLLCVRRCEHTSRRFKSFRSFDAAYEGSVLRVYVEALYIATYIRTCWFAIFHTNPRRNPAFRVESCGKLQRNRVENLSASAWISASACTRKARNSSEKLVIRVKYRMKTNFLARRTIGLQSRSDKDQW